jgi:hypothetical protein
MAESVTKPKRGRLTAKQKRFVDAVTGEAGGKNATAARTAGYHFPGIDSVKVSRTPEVVKAVKAHAEELSMGSRECLCRLGAHARADIADYASLVGLTDPKEIRAALLKLQKQGKAGGIKRLTPTRFGLAVEMVDTQAALTTLAKHLGLLRDKLDITIQTPQFDTAKIRALLSDPQGLDLVCALDSRLAALALPEPSEGPSGQVIDITPCPAEGPSEPTTDGSAPKPTPVGAETSAPADDQPLGADDD